MPQYVKSFKLTTLEKGQWREYFWVLYVVGYFIFVGAILLNVIFALIVDTFSNLRELTKQSELVLSNNCFICNLDREKFPDFNTHIEQEHNRFHYVFFFVYLKNLRHSKGIEQMSTVELYVHDRILERDFSFIPRMRALVLEAQGAQDDNNDYAKLNKKIDALTDYFRQQEKVITLTSTAVSQLQDEVDYPSSTSTLLPSPPFSSLLSFFALPLASPSLLTPSST